MKIMSLLTAGILLVAGGIAQAQQPPATLVLSTALVQRMAMQLQAMSAYMDGSAARESAAILADLQREAANQPKPTEPTPAAKPADAPAAKPPEAKPTETPAEVTPVKPADPKPPAAPAP